MRPNACTYMHTNTHTYPPPPLPPYEYVTCQEAAAAVDDVDVFETECTAAAVAARKKEEVCINTDPISAFEL